MAKVRTARNVAGNAAECRGVEPELTAGVVPQAAARDPVRADRSAAGIQIGALGYREGKSTAQGQDAVHLPSLDEVSRRAVQALAEWKIVDEVEHGAMGLVELETPPRGSAIAWILKIAVFISAGFAVSHRLAVRIRESVHQTVRIALFERRLKAMVRSVAIAVDQAQASQVLNAAGIVKLLERTPPLEIRIRRWIRTVKIGDRVTHVARFATDVPHR